MFTSKKKIKAKESESFKEGHKNITKNISKQFKSFMGRRKPPDMDNVSQVTSVDSNTDNSIKSLVVESNNPNKVINDIQSLGDENELENEEKDLKYPTWYKQTLNLPPCKPLNPESEISLNISRTPNGDFGFVLRKGNYVERFTNDEGYFNELKDLAIFAEPVNMNRENLLVPGDKLIKVNQIDVQSRLREEIIDIIKSCGAEVKLTIQPSLECLEFSFRRFSNLFFNHINIRTWLKEKKCFCGLYKEMYNKVINNFESIQSVELVPKDTITSSSISNSEEKVWVNFNEGFAAGLIIEKLERGKCRVKLMDNDSEIEVLEEDIHPANSANYDLEEAMLILPHLNESNLLYTIRQRFANNLIHTYVGKHILYINPMNMLNCFSEKAMFLFKSAHPEDMPPHVYSTAQNTYQSLKSTKENQSICILGRSGSGKSSVMKHLVNFFTCITSNNKKCNISWEKIQALWILLDAFTCTRTGINTNATRCGKRVTLNFSHFNHNLILMGLHLQIFLFDKNRLFRRPEREPTYHIFYNFLAGVNIKQMQAYNLKFMNEPNSFMTPLQRESEKQLASEQWEMICQAAFMLGILESEWDVICRILATIIHLGAAKSTSYQQNSRTCGKFLNKDASRRAADTLSCSEEALHRAVFEFYKEDLDNNDGFLKNNCGISYNSQDLLDGIVSGLYSEVIEMIIYFINRCFNSSYSRTINSIIIVDPPGFQVPTSYNKKHIAIYEDLLYNYAYERLIHLNHSYNITKQKDLYNKENINLEFFNDIETYNPVLSLLDGDCKVEVFDTIGKKGLLNFIESEALLGDEISVIKKLYTLFQSHHKNVSDKKNRILKAINPKTGDFTINHCNRSQILKYNINDGLKYSRDLPTFSSAEVLLSMCHNDTIQNILTSLSKCQNEVSDMKYSNKSVLANNKLEMNDIIHCLTLTNHLSFIYCISPIPNAGLCQLKDSVDKHYFDENVTCGGLFSVPLVKIQLQSFQILPILRVMKFGYPESLTFDNFFYIVQNMIPPSEMCDSNINANSIMKMLNYLKVNPKRYRIGDNQLFFRLGTVFELKNSRELASTIFVIKLQSVCRQYLARKAVEKLKLQTDAIRIIQRNSLMYLKIKEWPWWKIYSQIRPLIRVLRIDEELKIMKDMVTQLQLKNQELENEKDRFKKEERQFENSLDDLKNEQIIYRQKIQKLTSVLEDKERNQMTLEKKIEKLQEEMIEYDDKILVLENELSRFKSTKDQKENGDDFNKIGSKINSEQFKDLNIEKLIKESKSQKEELEIELVKTKKVCDNLKLEIEEFKYQAENNITVDELEQKQKNYEKEINRLHKALSEESSNREKLKRENDKFCSEKLLLEKELKEIKKEMSRNVTNFQPITSIDFSNMELEEREYLFKKQKTELDQRIRELEEEIDEVNDNYDLIQKEKMKLKLQIEKLNQDRINELNEKEDEIEHMKISNAKKLKNIELQLEEDSLKRQSLIRDKREADRHVLELKQQLEIQKDLSLEKKLKKELKCTKDLLNDALDKIEELKNRRENKSEIKELKDKLDDAAHANEILLKQKGNKERELEECLQELENLTKFKYELESKLKQYKSDFLNIQNHNEDMETQIEQSDRKLKQLQSQIVLLNDFNNNLQEKVETLEDENKRFVIKIEKLDQELSSHNYDQVDKSETMKLQNKISELEMKLHYEDSTKSRLQSTNEKLKDQLYEAQADKESFQSKLTIDQDRLKKLERQLKESRENDDNQSKEISELKIKLKTLTDQNIDMEEELEKKTHECKLSKQRIQKLEQMLENDEETSDHSYSEILSKADNMIKTRKFSIDQNLLAHRNHDDDTLRRNSVTTDRFSSHFSKDNDKY